MNLFRSIASWFAICLVVAGVAAAAANDARAQAQLSDVERLRWELAAARSQLHVALAEREGCRVQLIPIRGAEVRAEIAKLKADVEAAHDCEKKGCTFDVEKGILVFTSQAETEKRK